MLNGVLQPGLLNDVILQLGLLLGFAAFVSLLVNVGKFFKIVKDGTADKWVAGFNFAAVLVLYVVRTINPDFDPFKVDTVLGELAVVGGYIFSFVSMVLESKVTYFASRGLPVVGTSNSKTTQVVAVISTPKEGVVTETITTEKK